MNNTIIKSLLLGLFSIVLCCVLSCSESGDQQSSTSDESAVVDVSPAPSRGSTGGDIKAPRSTVVAEKLISIPAGQDRPEPPIEVSPDLIDFGRLAPLQSSSVDLSIHNRGNAPVQIQYIIPNCKCTTITNADLKVIAPGETLTVTATIRPGGKIQPRSGRINIKLRGYQSIPVEFMADITYVIKTTPHQFITKTMGKRGTVQVESLDRIPFRIIAANGEAPVYISFNPERDELRNSYELTWDISRTPCDQMKAYWVIETDHPMSPLADVWVFDHCTVAPTPDPRKWFPEAARWLIGVTKPNRSVEVDLILDNARPDASIDAIRSGSDQFEAELLNVERIEQSPNQIRLRVRITPNPLHRGLLYGKLYISGNAQERYVIIIGKVEE